MQKEVEAELDRLVGQEGAIHTKMLALQRMGYSLDISLVSKAQHLFEFQSSQSVFCELSPSLTGPTYS